MINKNDNKIAALLLLIYSIATRVLTSIHSLLYSKDAIDGDGACFVAVGREILKGKVLYKDIFDHKTPYIYLIHGLASLADYNHIGLFFLEVVVLFVTLYFIYKILVLTFERAKFKGNIELSNNQKFTISLIGAFIIGIALSNYDITEGYYRTEPFVVSLVLPAVYLLGKYYYGRTPTTRIPRQMFIIGLLAGITFMINLKGIILFVPLVVPLTYDFIKHKQWTGLFKTFCLGLSGVILAILPYVVYMLITDSVKDMVFALWDTNLAYAKDYMIYDVAPQGFLEKVSTKDGMIMLVIAFALKSPYIMALLGLSVVILIVLNYNKHFKIAICLQVAVLCITIFSVGRPHIYYLYSLLPYLIVIYILFVLLFINYCLPYFVNLKNKLLSVIVIVLCFIFPLGINYIKNYHRVSNIGMALEHNAESLRDVVRKYDSNFSDLNVLALGFHPEVYLWLDADIKCKFFARPFISYDTYRIGIDEQVKYINRLEPDVLCIKNFEFVPKELERQVLFVLNYYYDLIGETDRFYVYGKKR